MMQVTKTAAMYFARGDEYVSMWHEISHRKFGIHYFQVDHHKESRTQDENGLVVSQTTDKK